MAETIITRICVRCKAQKPLEDFYKGKHPWCKACRKESVQKYRQTERGKLLKRLASRRRYKKPEVKLAARKRQQSPKARAYQKQYREKNKERKHAYLRAYRQTEHGRRVTERGCRKYRQNNPEKRRAKNAVDNRIQKGLMPRASACSCVRCGNQAQEYHHWSYEKEHWLDVIPVCVSCHNIIHEEQSPV